MFKRSFNPDLSGKTKASIIFIFLLFLSSLAFALDSLEVIMTFEMPDSVEFRAYNPNRTGSDLNNDVYDDFVYINLFDNPTEHLFYFGSPIPDPIPDLELIGPSHSGFPSWGGDLNGDGYNDIVYGVRSGMTDPGNIYICLGGDCIDIEPELILHGGNYAPDPYNLCFTGINGGYDFNGDGYDDILAGGRGPSYFWNGQVDLFFGGEEIDTIPDFHIQGAIVDGFGTYKTVGDINGDGYDDLIASRFINFYELIVKLEIYLGGSNMNTVMDYEIPGEFCNPILVCNGDINNDGCDDLIIGDYGIYFGNPEGELNIDIPLYGRPFYCNINGDEYSDIVSWVNSDSAVYIYYGSDNFNIEPDVILSIAYFQLNHFKKVCCNLGDFNGDGKDEIVINNGEPYNSANVYTLSGGQSVEENYKLRVTNYEINAYPNPFMHTTHISFSLNNSNQIQLDIYNIRGQKVKNIINTKMKGGYHITQWDGRDNYNQEVTSGVYLYQLTAGNRKSGIKKMLLLK